SPRCRRRAPRVPCRRVQRRTHAHSHVALRPDQALKRAEAREWLDRGIPPALRRHKDASVVRRGLLLTILAFAALAFLQSAATAAPGDPVVHIDPRLDGGVFPQGYELYFGFACTSDISAIVSCEGSPS